MSWSYHYRHVTPRGADATDRVTGDGHAPVHGPTAQRRGEPHVVPPVTVTRRYNLSVRGAEKGLSPLLVLPTRKHVGHSLIKGPLMPPPLRQTFTSNAHLHVDPTTRAPDVMWFWVVSEEWLIPAAGGVSAVSSFNTNRGRGTPDGEENETERPVEAAVPRRTDTAGGYPPAPPPRRNAATSSAAAAVTVAS